MSMHAKEQGKLLETCSNDKPLSSNQTNVENTATNPGQSNNLENSTPPAARADEPSVPLVRSLRGQIASEHRPTRQRENSSRLRRDECRIELDLSRSELRVLPPTLFHPTDVLTHLYLSSNALEDLPSGLESSLACLTYLDLRYNKLTNVPTLVVRLLRLEVLLLQNNQISALPAQLGVLPRLTSLSYSGNPLLFPPHSVAAQGWPHVRIYLASLLDRADSAAATSPQVTDSVSRPPAGETGHQQGTTRNQNCGTTPSTSSAAEYMDSLLNAPLHPSPGHQPQEREFPGSTHASTHLTSCHASLATALSSEPAVCSHSAQHETSIETLPPAIGRNAAEITPRLLDKGQNRTEFKTESDASSLVVGELPTGDTFSPAERVRGTGDTCVPDSGHSSNENTDIPQNLDFHVKNPELNAGKPGTEAEEQLPVESVREPESRQHESDVCGHEAADKEQSSTPQEQELDPPAAAPEKHSISPRTHQLAEEERPPDASEAGGRRVRSGRQRRCEVRLAVSMPGGGVEGSASLLVSQVDRSSPTPGSQEAVSHPKKSPRSKHRRKVYLHPPNDALPRAALPMKVMRFEPVLPLQRPPPMVAPKKDPGRRSEPTAKQPQAPPSAQSAVTRQGRRKGTRTRKRQLPSTMSPRKADRSSALPVTVDLELSPEERLKRLHKLQRQRQLQLLQHQSNTIFLSGWREKARKMQKEVFFRHVKYASGGVRCGQLVSPPGLGSPGRAFSVDPLVADGPQNPSKRQGNEPRNVTRSWTERVKDGEDLDAEVSAVVRKIQQRSLRPTSSPAGHLRQSSQNLLELEALLRSVTAFRERHPLPH